MSGLSIFGNWIAGAGFGISLVGMISGIPIALSLLGFGLAMLGLICVVVG